MRVKPKARLRKKKLIWAPYSGTCGLGTVCEVRLVVDGETVHTYYTCPCGRGCGNKDEVPQDLPMEWE